jgi:hypothetical protein
MTCANFSAARPEEMATSIFRRASAMLSATPPSTSISAPSA